DADWYVQTQSAIGTDDRINDDVTHGVAPLPDMMPQVRVTTVKTTESARQNCTLNLLAASMSNSLHENEEAQRRCGHGEPLNAENRNGPQRPLQRVVRPRILISPNARPAFPSGRLPSRTCAAPHLSPARCR